MDRHATHRRRYRFPACSSEHPSTSSAHRRPIGNTGTLRPQGVVSRCFAPRRVGRERKERPLRYWITIDPESTRLPADAVPPVVLPPLPPGFGRPLLSSGNGYVYGV